MSVSSVLTLTVMFTRFDVQKFAALVSKANLRLVFSLTLADAVAPLVSYKPVGHEHDV